jgi:hypothetical protein
MNGSEHSGELRDGTLVAMAGVALTVTVALVTFRFGDEWGAGVLFLLAAVPAAAVLAYALPVDVATRPPAWLSGLYGAAFVLAVIALANLADVLGASEDPGSGAIVWTGALLAAGWGAIAWARGSGLSALLAAAAAAVTLVAFVDFAFDPDGASTFRYVLVAIAAVLVVAAAVVSATRLDHATALADVAGLTALALALTFAFELLFFSFGGEETQRAGTAWGWELALLLVGAALCAFAAIHHVAGPGWIGATVLAAFALLAIDSEDPSLVGWPIVLAIVTAVLCAAAVV